MDGVLADMNAALGDEVERLFGLPAAAAPKDGVDDADPPPDRPRSRNPLTARQESRLWERVKSIENFWESLSEIEPGIVARLHALAIKRRWEVIFLTKRPATAGDTAQRQTQRWLEAHGFMQPSVYVVQGPRGLIAAALDLDFVVDDLPENCLGVAVDSKARPILVWPGDETQLTDAVRRLGIGVVTSVAHCLDILDQIGPADVKSGVMTRVLRLLGLSEPAET
jgi:hypothetical protein